MDVQNVGFTTSYVDLRTRYATSISRHVPSSLRHATSISRHATSISWHVPSSLRHATCTSISRHATSSSRHTLRTCTCTTRSLYYCSPGCTSSHARPATSAARSSSVCAVTASLASSPSSSRVSVNSTCRCTCTCMSFNRFNVATGDLNDFKTVDVQQNNDSCTNPKNTIWAEVIWKKWSRVYVYVPQGNV